MQWQPLSASLTSSQVSITQRKPRKRIKYFFNNCYISNDALHVYFYTLLKIHIDFIIIFTFVKYHHLYKRKFFYNHFVLYIQRKASIHSERSTCRRVRNKTENWAKAVEGNNTSYKSYMKYCSVQFVMYPQEIGKFLFFVTVIKLVRDAKLSGNVNHSIHHIINQSKKKEIRRLWEKKNY